MQDSICYEFMLNKKQGGGEMINLTEQETDKYKLNFYCFIADKFFHAFDATRSYTPWLFWKDFDCQDAPELLIEHYLENYLPNKPWIEKNITASRAELLKSEWLKDFAFCNLNEGNQVGEIGDGYANSLHVCIFLDIRRFFLAGKSE